MKQSLVLLLWAVAGCASVPETPDTHGEATEEERKLDAAKLLEEREKEGNLDRAVRVLEWQASQKPKDEKTRLLAAEAYSRSLEDMGEKKKTDTTKAKRLLTQGGLHAQAAIDIAPGNAAALYWRACLMLHQADVEGSLGKAKEAIAMLEKADAADPKTDNGGPSRMMGRVYYEMPALVGGSVKKAVALYKRSLSVAPMMLTTHLWLGEAYADGKLPDYARREWEWVTSQKPRPGHEKEDGADIKAAQEKLKTLK